MNEFLSSEGNKCWQTQNTCNREQNWKKCNHRIFIERLRTAAERSEVGWSDWLAVFLNVDISSL